jgi:transcriptional regulator with XRE-family HTH domain
MVKTLEEKLATLSPERLSRVEARTAELIAEEMSLRELRQAMGKTQAKVAAELGVGQDSVARYEQRTDMLLSTLTQFVNKVGGTLELTATFADRKPIRITGFGELVASPSILRSPKVHTVRGSRKGAPATKDREIAGKRAGTRVKALRKGRSPELLSHRADTKLRAVREQSSGTRQRAGKSG